MKRKITKKSVSFSINPKLDELMIKLFENKSKYIEWLIYEDIKKHLSEDELKNIFI